MATSSTVSESSEAVDATTMTEALRRTATNHPDVVAMRTVDDSVSITWAELYQRVRDVAGGFARLGVEPGENVALFLSNRVEFAIVDLAVATLGATPFSIYTTYPADEVAYLCRDAGARLMITEQQFLPLVRAARDQLPDLEHVVLVDGDSGERELRLEEVEASNPGFDADGAAAAVQPDDILTLIYTSGTTGPPKGVQITHRNAMVAARGAHELTSLEAGSRVISWLPAAHIAERMAHHYMPTVYACTVTVCPNQKEVVSFLPQVRPTWFFAVPRIWEKVKAGLEAMQASQPAEVQEPVAKALNAAIERIRLRQRGEPVPPELEAAVAKADAEMFSHLRTMLGFDQLHAVNVGAAPTAVEVLEFFHAIGVEVCELWGMSETCGYGLVNRNGQARLGTVGVPEPGCEVKLGSDGELLVRGEFVMRGYRNAPEKTAETIDPDGWLHTGDIAEIDSDGYVRIVDRKKELIINSAGKNMSPANIEAALKSGSPMIGQACCIGDRRPYNTALIVLDADYAPVWASQNGLEGRSLDELAEEPAVIAAVQVGIDEANSHLSRVEQIKKFAVIRGDWLAGGDELTPTMKLKRRPIAAKYGEQIEAMYSD
jgi:long-chain acyl-CoA synthetase